MTDITKNQSFDRPKSLAYPKCATGNEIVGKNIGDFILSEKEYNDSSLASAPIVWERLSTGFRVSDIHVKKINDVLETLKVCCQGLLFLIDQHTKKSVNLSLNVNVERYQDYVFDIISNGDSFCALEEGTAQVAGVVLAKVTSVSREENASYSPIHSSGSSILTIERILLSHAKIKERYNVNYFFYIHNFCVRDENLDYGIGTALIRTCLLRAKQRECSLCVGIFLSDSSQTIASQFGFKVLSKKTVLNNNVCNTPLDNQDINPVKRTMACMGAVISSNDFNSEHV